MTLIGKHLLDVQHKSSNEVFILKELRELCDEYLVFKEETINGGHGKTAELWIKYAEYIHLYHELSRSVRVGDSIYTVLVYKEFVIFVLFQSTKLCQMAGQISR